MCRAHIENLLTYFAHRATNASAEAASSRIQNLISKACGYRNPLRLITDIWFHFGDLDLEPRFAQRRITSKSPKDYVPKRSFVRKI